MSPLDAALAMRSAKNREHDTSNVLRLPRKMTSEVSKVSRLARKVQIIFCKRRRNILPATQNDFRRACRHVKMSGSATPATQNDITTCIETFNEERFCSFPHRHCDATGKSETREEIRWSIKTNISCETSSNFTIHSFKIDVFLQVFLRIDLKINVSCEACVDFHQLSQNASATEFAPCHHCAQR